MICHKSLNKASHNPMVTYFQWQCQLGWRLGAELGLGAQCWRFGDGSNYASNAERKKTLISSYYMTDMCFIQIYIYIYTCTYYISIMFFMFKLMYIYIYIYIYILSIMFIYIYAYKWSYKQASCTHHVTCWGLAGKARPRRWTREAVVFRQSKKHMLLLIVILYIK